MKTRFENAIDALVYAFFNDTLAKGICTACAVGNMVAHSFGKKIDSKKIYESISVSEDSYIDHDDWQNLFTTFSGVQRSYRVSPEERRMALFCIDKTGYSVGELMKVEFAFETHTKIDIGLYHTHTKQQIMEDQYNGLMAVCKALCEIEQIDYEETEEILKRFEYAS